MSGLGEVRPLILSLSKDEVGGDAERRFLVRTFGNLLGRDLSATVVDGVITAPLQGDCSLVLCNSRGVVTQACGGQCVAADRSGCSPAAPGGSDIQPD